MASVVDVRTVEDARALLHRLEEQEVSREYMCVAKCPELVIELVIVGVLYLGYPSVSPLQFIGQCL